jgi:uncharacterized protein (DUF885 family)
MNTFESLINEYKEIMLDNPVVATELGEHSKDFDLPNLSKENKLLELERCEKLLTSVCEFENSSYINSLSFDDKVDFDLLKLGLEHEIFLISLKINELFDFEQKPNLGSYVINSVMSLFLKDSRSSDERLDRILSRFSKMPDMISSYSGVLKKVVARWKFMEIEELEGAPDLFNNILDWAKTEKYSKVSEMSDCIDKIKLSIDEYLVELNSLDEVSNFSLTDFEVSEIIRFNGVDLNRDEVFDIAKKFYSENNELLLSLKDKIISKYSLDVNSDYHKVLTFVKEKFSLSVEEVVPTYKKEHENIMTFLESNDLFVFPKDDKLNIMKTPSYLVPTIPVGAMFPPAPFSSGPKTSMIYLTIDEGRLKDQNSLMIRNTMIHEGIPGHHLQFSVAYEHKSVVRNLASYNTHAEGWTTYLEEFMTDSGIVSEEIIDEYRFIGHSDLARLAARVCIDLFFLTSDEKYLKLSDNFEVSGDSVFDKAKSLLIEATGFSSARADGELNWYSKERGYPMCYLVGNRMVWKLKSDMKECDNKDKLFHKTYLESGVLTLPLLRKVFENKGLLK